MGQFEENTIVILSEVAGSHSEAATQSKDPYTLTEMQETRRAFCSTIRKSQKTLSISWQQSGLSYGTLNLRKRSA